MGLHPILRTCIKDKIDLAIEQEKYFCEDIEKLKTDLGTNIGLLLASMKA